MMVFRLLTLSMGSFAVGTGAYVVAGVLVDISEDLSVSVVTAGHLVTIFALTFAVASPVLVAATSSVSRRRLIVEALVGFALANAAAAFVSSFSLLLLVRVFAALGALFLEHVYFEDEVSEYNSMVRNRRPVALLSEATNGKLQRALRHRECAAPAGLDYELRSVFTSNRELWGAIDLYRERGAPDFSANEVAFFRRVASHLGTGLRAAVLLSQASLVQEGDGAPGVLVLDRRGWVVHYTAAAERWLHELEEGKYYSRELGFRLSWSRPGVFAVTGEKIFPKVLAPGFLYGGSGLFARGLRG